MNAGYITNLKKGTDSKRADSGGSVRIGLLHRGLFGNGRMGIYAGYTWYREYNLDNVDYDDSGFAFIGGVDYKLLRINDFQLYIKGGLGPAKYISTYPTYKETEISIKPELGLLFCYRYINFYAGWQPSDAQQINIGIGLILYKNTRSAEPNS